MHQTAVSFAIALAFSTGGASVLYSSNPDQSVSQAPSTLFVDSIGPPATLAEFVNRSTAVVHAVVKTTSEPILDPSSSPRAPRAIRLQTMRVVDVCPLPRLDPGKRRVRCRFRVVRRIQGRSRDTRCGHSGRRSNEDA
jgi:hypothetical protein